LDSRQWRGRGIPSPRARIRRSRIRVIRPSEAARDDTNAARGSAIVDISKLENGKIVEHWDVLQEIPEKAAHATGMS
jgi:hypothetical protein